MTGNRLLLLDTASLYFRAFFGLPATMRAPDGRQINAVRGLLDFLSFFVARYSPTHVACAWDVAWRPAWRVALVPTYKGHRVAHDDVEEVPAELEAQIPLIEAVLGAVGVAIVGAPDCEADDVIGTLATAATMPCDIATGDRDLFQLVDDGRSVRVLYCGRGVSKHELVTDAWLLDKYGLTGAGYADFALLRGDPSDGLPGVKGIGEKTAAKLVADHKDLEGILTAAGDGRIGGALGARLAGAIDYLGAASEVVRVRSDAAVGVAEADLILPDAPADPERFEQLRDELDLGGSADRLLAALAERLR